MRSRTRHRLLCCAFTLAAAGWVGACGSDEEPVPQVHQHDTAPAPVDGGFDAEPHAPDAPGGGADTGSDVSADFGYYPSPDTTSSYDTTHQADAGSWSDTSASADVGADTGGNTNVNLGGVQDFGYFRGQLADGIVPHPDNFDADGFFAEHHTELPQPDCGERLCVQTMLGVFTNLVNGNNCTLLQLGLNSPIVASPDHRPPLDLVVVVDTSGSMSGEKIEYVNAGMSLLVDGLFDGDRLAVVRYTNDVHTVLDLTDVRGQRARIRDDVTSLEARGGTNLHDGLRAGYEIALAHYNSGRQSRVILISDGNPTSGITSQSAIVDLATRYAEEGIGITTIGLGTDFNVELVRAIAESGDGNYYFVENASAVDEVFEEELSYFSVPVAFDLVLDLTEGADYAITNVHGSRKWTVTEEGGRLEIPSVFLAHRVSHDDVHEGGGRRGGGSALMVELMPRTLRDDDSGRVSGDVGAVRLEFREPGTDAIIEETVNIAYPHAPWIVLDGGFFDAPLGRQDIIQKSFVMLNIYYAMRTACETFHRDGSAGTEIEVLLRLIAAVRDYNEEIGDVDMEYDIALMEELVEVLLANEVPPAPPEWQEPEDPWPCD